MAKDNLTDEEKLKYLQIKIHEITLECINNYILAKEDESLFHTFLSLVFMTFRNSVDTSISVPYRHKSFKSVVDNIEKEVLKLLTEKLPDNCTISDIDELAPGVVKSICKDFLGATIVFHSKNNLSTYCEESDNLYIKQLYKQVLTVDKYLRSNEKDNNSSIFSRIINIFKTIDISNTFIDENPNPLAPTKLKPLDLNNINTLEDYYSTLIGLLTLLTNLSLPCTESVDGKVHKYCVSELDTPYLQLVEQAKSQNPKNKDEFIKILTDLAHKSYYRKYIPFDEQLDTALEEQAKAKNKSSYREKLLPIDKKRYTQELINLKNNLQQIKNDRLLNYVLKLELPNIFSQLSELPNLHVEIKDKKERAKSDGFYSCYYTVELNGIVICEIQGHSEFRSILTKEGNAAHNLLPQKSFDIKPLFELKAFPLKNTPEAQKQLDLYCEFLDTVNFNNISGYHIPKEDKNALRDLQDLVNYATSKISVKDFITEKNGSTVIKVPFYKYITNILSTHGAEHGTIYAAHIVEHNQALLVPQSSLYSLENILKSRVGLSALASLIREKYREASPNDSLTRSSGTAKTFSSSLSSKFDISEDNQKIKNSLQEFEPLDLPYKSIGEVEK